MRWGYAVGMRYSGFRIAFLVALVAVLVVLVALALEADNPVPVPWQAIGVLKRYKPDTWHLRTCQPAGDPCLFGVGQGRSPDPRRRRAARGLSLRTQVGWPSSLHSVNQWSSRSVNGCRTDQLRLAPLTCLITSDEHSIFTRRLQDIVTRIAVAIALPEFRQNP